MVEYKVTVYGHYFIVLITVVIFCHAQNQNELWPRFGISQNALNTISGIQRRWPIGSVQNVERSRLPSSYGNVYGNRNKRSTAEVLSENIISVSAKFHDKLRKKRQINNNQNWDFHPASLVRRRMSTQRPVGTGIIPGPQITGRKDRIPQPKNIVPNTPNVVDRRQRTSTRNAARPRPPVPAHHRQQQPRPATGAAHKTATPTRQSSLNQNTNVLHSDTLPQYNVMASKAMQRDVLINSIKQMIGNSDRSKENVPSGSMKNTQVQNNRTPNNTPSPRNNAMVTNPSQSLSRVINEATNLVQKLESRIDPRPKPTNKPTVQKPLPLSQVNYKPPVKTHVIPQNTRRLNRGQPLSSPRFPRPQATKQPQPPSSGSAVTSQRLETIKKLILQRRTKQNTQGNALPPTSQPIQTNPHTKTLTVQYIDKTTLANHTQVNPMQDVFMGLPQGSQNKPLHSQPTLNNPAPTQSNMQRSLNAVLSSQLQQQTTQAPIQHIRNPMPFQRTSVNKAQQTRAQPRPTIPTKQFLNKLPQRNNHKNTPVQGPPPKSRNMPFSPQQTHGRVSANSQQRMQSLNQNMKPLLPPSTKAPPVSSFVQNTNVNSMFPAPTHGARNQQGFQPLKQNMQPLLPPSTKASPVPSFVQNTNINSMLQAPTQTVNNDPLGAQLPAWQPPTETQQNMSPILQNLNLVQSTQSPLQAPHNPSYVQGSTVNEVLPLVPQVLQLYPPSPEVLSPTVPPQFNSRTTVPPPVMDFLATQNPLSLNTFDLQNTVAPSSQLWSQNPQQPLQGANKQSIRNGNQLGRGLATNPNTALTQPTGTIDYLPQLIGIDYTMQLQSQGSPDIIVQQLNSNKIALGPGMKPSASQPNQGVPESWSTRQKHKQQRTLQERLGITEPWRKGQAVKQQNIQQPRQGVTEPWPRPQPTNQRNIQQPHQGVTEPWPRPQPTNQRNIQQPHQGVTEPWPRPQPTNQRNMHQPHQGVTESWPRPQPTNQRNMQQPHQGVTEPWPRPQPTNQRNIQQPPQGVTEPWPRPQPTNQRNIQQPPQGVTEPWPRPQPTNQRNMQQPHQGVTESWPRPQPTNQRNMHQPHQGVAEPWPRPQPTNQRNMHQPHQGVTESWPRPQPTNQRNIQQPHQGVTEPWPRPQPTNQRNIQQPHQGVTEPWPRPQPTNQRNIQQPPQGVTEPWPRPQPTNQQNMQQPHQGVIEPWPRPQPTNQRNMQQPRQGTSGPRPQHKQTNNQNVSPMRGFAEPLPRRQQASFHGIGVTEPLHRQKQNRQRGVTEPWPLPTSNQQQQQTVAQQRRQITEPVPLPQQRNKQQQLSPVVTEPLPQQPKLLSQQTIQKQNGVTEPLLRQPHTIQRNRVVTEPIPKTPNTHSPFLGVTQSWAQQLNVDVGYAISTPQTFNAQPAFSSSSAKKSKVNARPRHQGVPLPVYTVQTTTVLPPSVPTTVTTNKAVRQSVRNGGTQVNQQAQPQINQPKLLPATLFPLQNQQNEVTNTKSMAPNFVQQNIDVAANTAVKTPLEPIKLWRPATSVPIDQIVRKVPVENGQSIGHGQHSSQVNRSVKDGQFVKNWFSPRDFPNIPTQTGSNTNPAEMTNNNNIAAISKARRQSVAGRTNNGRKSSKRHRVAVADRISGVVKNNIKRPSQNIHNNSRPEKSRPIVSNSGVENIHPEQSNTLNPNVPNVQQAGSGRRMASKRRKGAQTNTTPSPVQDNSINGSNNNSSEFVDRIRTLLHQIQAEHATTHEFTHPSPQSTTSATNVVSQTQAPMHNQVNSWNASIKNNTSNVSQSNTATAKERKRNKTITVTKTEKITPVQSGKITPVQSAATAAHHDHHHPPINFNVFLEWTMPTVSPAHAKTNSQTDALRLLQALRSIHDIPHAHVPQTATKPPVNIILHVESERQAGKLTCRCFSKSDGCPYELKEEPLMDMCDIKNEVPCCDDH